MKGWFDHRKKLITGQLAILALTGCQALAGDDGVRVEDNELGIVRVEIRHDVSNGDHVLTARGFDADDQEVGMLALRTGLVQYTPEPELIAPRWNRGTELTVQLGADRFTSVTPDLLPHEERLSTSARIASFVRLSTIAAEVEKEAGIWFAQPRAAADTAYQALNCDPYTFPISPGSQDQCCWDGYESWGKNHATGKLSHRLYASPCGMSDGLPGACGADISVDCDYGPAGGKADPVPNPNDANAVVFVPSSTSTVCGRDSNGTAAGGGTEAPEAYNGTQTLYPASGATNENLTCCYNSSTGESEPQHGPDCLQSVGESCVSGADCYTGNCEDWVCHNSR